MRGLIPLIAVYALIAMVLLSGCTDGRWVVHDLSNVSFQFTSPTPAGPFAPPRPRAAANH